MVSPRSVACIWRMMITTTAESSAPPSASPAPLEKPWAAIATSPPCGDSITSTPAKPIMHRAPAIAPDLFAQKQCGQHDGEDRHYEAEGGDVGERQDRERGEVQEHGGDAGEGARDMQERARRS